MSFRLTRSAVVLGLFLTAGGCAPEADPLGTADADPLGDMAIHGVYDEPVRLAGGRYEGEPFQPGAASRPTLTLLPEPRAEGDLDGDGAAETVALLAENSGGSGVFVYLAVVDRAGSAPENVATRLLGDRVRVSSLVVEDGQILVSMTERDASGSDAATDLTLALVNGDLLERQVLLGLLVLGHEVRSFTVCDSDTAAWFVDATDDGVRSAYEALAPDTYEALLFEVVGSFGPPPETGFGAEYAYTVTIHELVSATRGTCDG
jgi:hypothetical protein